MLENKFYFEVEVEKEKFQVIGPSNTTYLRAFQATDMVRAYFYGKLKEAEEQKAAADKAAQQAVEQPQAQG